MSEVNGYCLNGLPEGWQWVKLGEATLNYDGKRVPLSREVRSKRQGGYRYYGATEIVDYVDNYIFDGEYLLIGEDGANLLSKARPLAFIVDGKFWVNNHAHVLKAKDLLELKFLCYYINSLNLSSYVTGSAQPKLTQANLNKIPVPLPRKEVQQKIVSKIEELFSELDKSIESLKTVQQQLKVYRQSVLKWAFEGRLTNEELKEGELPKTWKKVRIDEVAKTFGGYAFKSSDFKDHGKYQVLRMGNVRPGQLRFNESPVFLNYVEETVCQRSLLKLNDVIITLTGTRKKRDYGFSALITHENLLLNQRIAAIRFKECYSPKFFLYYSWTNEFKDQFFANETGNVGQGNVGMRAITQTIIPFPPIKEENIIVQEIESRLSIADKVEQTIVNSLEQAEALRQSILKKAFEGLLINNSEPTEPSK